MKFKTLLSIFFELLEKRKLTAGYLAEKYEISPRTVYRYVELLAEHVPIFVKRGRNGGVYLSDNYKLPFGFLTQAEYDSVLSALAKSYAESSDELFLRARRKISAQRKEERKEILISEEIGDVVILEERSKHSETLRLIQESLREKTMLRITRNTQATKTEQRIEPHALLFCNCKWELLAFCHDKRRFERFSIEEIYSVFKTKETFHKRPFDKNEFSPF